MVGCCAFGCSNRSEQGYLMKAFPRDLARRNLWASKVKRANWKPTDSSRLCQIHFASDMWERVRVDGKRILKRNALPTIFSFTASLLTVPKRKPPKNRTSLQDATPSPTSQNDNSIPSTSKVLTSAEEEVQLGSSSSSLSSSKCSEDTTEFEKASVSEQSNLEMMENKLQRYNKQYNKLLNKTRRLQNKIHILKRKERKTVTYDKELLKTIFNEDQVLALAKSPQKFQRWSNATVTKALKLKFSCGTSGYQEILKQNVPLPSIRTLRRRLQNIYFDSGVLTEVMEFLKVKVEGFSHEYEKHCSLTLDEMAISPAQTYDVSLKKYLGNVTLPNHTGVATHALALMLGGVNTRWKQTVAYYFTGDSVNGAVYQDIIFEVIRVAESCGLKILSITSDMGASNQALWRLWHVNAGRHSKTNNFIVHPLDAQRKIYIIADVSHLFKNIKNMLMSNKTITIPDYFVAKHNLPTNIVDAGHINELFEFEKGHDLRLAPKLTEEDLVPTHFQKMKVSKSTHVVSHNVSTALKFLSQECNKPSYKTTAWFLDTVQTWFKLMNSRHPVLGLSKHKPEEYNKKVGGVTTWKPSQTGVLISTQSILHLQAFLLDTVGYEFILTSRFMQDCLENLFSVIRSRQSVPNAVQFKENLKLVSVSQYLKDIKTSSYDQDDREYLADFLNIVSTTSSIT